KVVESAAIGVLSEVGEEDIKIFIILKQNEKLSPEGILDWCVEKMAYFMIPRYVEFVDEFPKTSTERIQKYKLIEKGNEASWDREAENYVIKR
ncbi:MAG TPA: ATP-dependent acyl-CoA ligase, partial [Massilibacterium sp.]|nr:ATP-dependent acyl-CoA ligase [Massilibacterium sp.]